MRPIAQHATFVAILCAGLCSSGSVLAQPLAALPAQDASSTQPQENGPGPDHGGMHRGPMSPDQELSHLTKALDLTSDQQTQIKPILQDRHDQLMQLHQDGSLSRDARMAKMKTLDDESNTKLQAVLNDQQKTKYEKMVADRKERMAQMRGMHHGGDDGSAPQ